MQSLQVSLENLHEETSIILRGQMPVTCPFNSNQFKICATNHRD